MRLVAEECSVETPATEDGLVEVLASLVDGVGPARARKFVRSFEPNVPSVLGTLEACVAWLDGRLVLPFVPGGHPSALMLRCAWRANSLSREADVELASLGLSHALRARLIDRYGDGALDRVRSDPYALCREVDGVGFKTADEVARRLGLPPASDERLSAAAAHVLREEAEARGHVWYPREELERLVGHATETAFDEAAWVRVLGRAAERGAVALSEYKGDGPPNVAHGPLARDEEAIARFVAERKDVVSAVSVGERLDLHGWRRPVRTGSEASHLVSSDEQTLAVGACVLDRFVVVTGGPGTGKTTTTRRVCDEWDYFGRRFLLCAPTGRAAQRLSEATGREASTVHRLLEWRGGSFSRNAGNPLDCDACLVDEASMVDSRLLRALCDALPPAASLVLVGDADQLPPVGPGAPLRDLVTSVPTAVRRLTEIHRQAAGSRVVSGSRDVLRGRPPEFSPPGDRSDGVLLFAVEESDPETLRALVVELAAELLPAELGVEPRDVQVMSPRRRGPLGVRELNRALQAKLNPGGPVSPGGGASLGGVSAGTRGDVETVFRVGDRVLQTSNDYERGVVNGEVGRVVDVSKREGGVVLGVEFDGREVTYDRDQLRGLDLAYATTVHKAQGSEYPVVLFVCHSSHGFGLDRTLVYTAITRARRACVVVGERAALGRACRKETSGARRTTLPSAIERLVDGKDGTS
jgi:exodeoxyribonuclease V alpha subunit